MKSVKGGWSRSLGTPFTDSLAIVWTIYSMEMRINLQFVLYLYCSLGQDQTYTYTDLSHAHCGSQYVIMCHDRKEPM